MKGLTEQDIIAELERRDRASNTLAGFAESHLDVIPAEHHKLICRAIDELLNDEYDELIINTPPGAAKSTYTSIALPAFFLNKWPKKHVLAASYSTELAEKWGRRVRNIVGTPEYRAQHGVELSSDSRSAGRWSTEQGGEFYAAGVGSGILGFRADLCLTENAHIRTRTGYNSISTVQPGDEIEAYDTEEFSTGYHRVVAVAERTTDLIYRIHTADGRVVEATGNHPFFTGGCFVSADSLVVGDTLLSSVWCPDHYPSIGDGEEAGQGDNLFLLQQELFDDPHEHHDEELQDPSDVQQLWEEIHLEGTWRTRRAGLLGSVPTGDSEEGRTQESNCSTSELRNLRETLPSPEQHHQVQVLLHDLQEHGTRDGDGWEGQRELATRDRSESVSGWERSKVQSGAETGDVSGQPRMRDLRVNGEPSRTSRGYGLDEQHTDEHSDSLPRLSHGAAWCRPGETFETTVARIEVVRGDTRVWDIQVEGVANFFANGILVHNCVIDDPISGFEEAQSLTQLQKVHGWYETDLVTRMKPGAKLVLICQRLARNDLAGYLIDRNIAQPTRRQKVLVLKMECEEGDNDPLGRAPGDRLWPEWFSPEMVMDAKRDDFKWRTLYQQAPPSDDGSWVSTEDIQFRPRPTVTSQSILYGMTDLALSVNTGDYTVHLVVAIDEVGDWDVVHGTRERVDPEQSSSRLVELAGIYRCQEWLIDDDNASKVFMPLVATKARSERVSVPWKPMPMRGIDKETRAAPLRGQFKRRKVYMPADAPYTKWLVKELLTFPNATGSGVDDGIDALGLLGRRMAALAKPAAPVVQLKRPTLQEMTLNQLFEDMPTRSTQRI